jgi:two-component system chemotaxis response regulator CheY
MMATTTNTKVLLVDDDPAILRLLSKWLAPHNYEVIIAANGREAIWRIEHESPDIIVTDWDMPHKDGIELCQWLRAAALPKYIYVLFLSVRCGSDDMIQALEAGADDFLKKPIDKGELLGRMRAGTRVLELESRLDLLAKTDSLTGLETQRTFFHSLETECGLAVRHQSPLSCVKIDIDRFTRINDVHGHRVGDDVIRRVGRTIVAGCRSSDIVARYGGEEFCVLLPDTGEDGAVLWADRIRNAISGLEFAVDRESLRISASCGVAQFSVDMQDNFERLIQAADEALLVAKGAGRDRVVGSQSLSQTGEMAKTCHEAWDGLGNVSAGDVMTNIVAGLRKDLPIASAANYFLRFRIPSAPVVDDAGELVGILSERDVMGVMLWPDWFNTRVEQVMKTNVITYDESTPVMQIYEFLCRVSIRAVVVVSDGKPTGILSRSSLVRWFTNALISQRDGQGEPASEVLACDPRERANSISLALRSEADRLVNALADGDENLTPALVGGASRMQELVNDLLASSPNLQQQLCSV